MFYSITPVKKISDAPVTMMNENCSFFKTGFPCIVPIIEKLSNNM